MNEIIIALSAVPAAEQIQRADALADLLESGEAVAVYDREQFLALVDRCRLKYRPMLEPGEG
jgi:hypothetical protein